MPEHNPGQMGGTMRLGKRQTIFRSIPSVLSMYPSQINGGLFAFWSFPAIVFSDN